MCFFSIIIPIFNSEFTISQCIDYVIKQTYTDYELLLIDDGSSDKSGIICDDYAKKDSRIRVIHQKNGGPSKARNTGLEAAVGDYIYFIDSDDSLANNSLEIIHSYLSRFKPDILKFGYIKRKNEEDTIVSCHREEFITEQWEMLDRTEGTQYCGFVWNSIFKRDCISNIRFREDFKWCEDHLFSFECFKNAKSMLLIPDCLYIYHISPLSDSLSTVHNPYLVYNMANAELPVKLSMVDDDHIRVKDGIWSEYYGKLNLAVKIIFLECSSYKIARNFRDDTIHIAKELVFPKTCSYARIFYKWPFWVSFILLKIKTKLNRR